MAWRERFGFWTLVLFFASPLIVAMIWGKPSEKPGRPQPTSYSHQYDDLTCTQTGFLGAEECN